MKFAPVAGVVLWCVLLVNPLGLTQRLFFGMRPPYHWSPNNGAYLGGTDLVYFSSNGKECAVVYKYGRVNDSFRVYGLGFGEPVNPGAGQKQGGRGVQMRYTMAEAAWNAAKEAE